ncbi:MAG: M56 family metallopeptidase [Planctomycetes bacterium]|nr:M56 family metallopeptidase [Planctomycetota bacterium]
MSAAELALPWLAAAAGHALSFAVAAALLLAIDALLLRRAPPLLRLALHGAVLLKLALPASLAASFGAPLAAARAVTEFSAVALPSALAAPPPPPAAWALPLVALWIVVAVALLVRSLRRVVAVRRALLADDLGASAALIAAARRAARRVGVRRLPRLVVSATAPSAALIGGGRALLVVPAMLQAEALVMGGRSSALDHALLHELVHWRRRDPWFGALAELLCIAWWFQPFAWWVARRAAALRELCCDDAVRRLLHDEAPAYRATLLSQARALLAAPTAVRPLAGGSAFLDRPATLRLRLEALARARIHRPRRERALAGLAAALALALLLPLGGGAAGPLAPLATARSSLLPPSSEFAVGASERALARQLLLDAATSGRRNGCLPLHYAVTLLRTEATDASPLVAAR